jgi:hydrogenase expression/formation protein HypD
MEVCGGQTHTIVRYGIDELLPAEIELVHGPGCPVCVTPLELIDRATEIAARPDVIFCSFGDMLRVPGSERDLLGVKASGGDVRIVYSPLDCLRIAEANPEREVVFFAVGFETTAPANAMAVWQARRRGIDNFSVLVSHVLVPPAIANVMSSPENRVQGFLAAGHVCAVMGLAEYEPLARRFGVPIVVTGFEPLDLLEGVYRCVRMLERGRIDVENQYARAVRPEGNFEAMRLVQCVFEVSDRQWRGLGTIPNSGFRLRHDFAAFDALRRFNLKPRPSREPEICISGAILRGTSKPPQCPAFGTGCTPENPLGATMVSSEGACATYYRCGRGGERSSAAASDRAASRRGTP